ncbi:MAG TPA: NAD(P)-dependent oxidoreductase [Bryobacteraceae bacterium]|nr:NAD(P)-dependent oxidoreductase [Bryobacteraceae bacterium]
MSRPRLLVIGAAGFVGQHVARHAAPAFDVIAAGHADIDITSATSVNAGIERAAPDVVVLTAALSDIDECERQPDLAEAMNVRGAEYVARACARRGTRLVFTSSGAVFDGTRHGYTESDPPSPVSVYGRTKAQAERFIGQEAPSALILRLSLVIGFAEGARTNSMLNRFEAKLRAGQPVLLPDFEFRNPIDVGTLNQFLLQLLESAAAGIVHIGGTEAVSRYELGVRLAGRMGLPAHLVQPQSEPVPGRAPRGPHHFLLPDKLRAICRSPVPTCNEVIERAIHGSSQTHS